MKKFLRLLFVLTLSLAFVFGMVACSDSGEGQPDWGIPDEGGPSSGKKTVVDFMHIWPEHAEAMQSIADAYMEKNENVIINITLSDYNNALSTLNTAWMGGNMPDVFFYWTHQMNEINNEEVMMAADLTQFHDDTEFLSQFVNSGKNWDIGKIDGKYYNIPFRATGFVICINETIFNKLGVSIPSTLEGLETAMSELYTKSDGVVTPLGVYGTTGTFPQIISAMETFYNISSGRTTDINYGTGRLEYSDEDIINRGYAIDKVKQWASEGYFGSSPAGGSRESVQTDFMNGNSAMCLINVNDFGTIQGQMKGSTLSAINIPAPSFFDTDYGYCSGGWDGFCISSKTTVGYYAIDFLKYLNSVESAQSFADTEKSVMSNGQVVYKDALHQQLFNCIKDVGYYDTADDFEISQSTKQYGPEIVSYVMGTTSKSINTILKNEKSSTLADLKDSAYNYPTLSFIAPTFNAAPFEASKTEFVNWCRGIN